MQVIIVISYAPFWDTLKHSDETTYTLINRHHLSSSTIDKLRKNKPVEQIADELEESDNITKIRDIVDLIREATPNLDMDEDSLVQNVLEKLSIKS